MNENQNASAPFSRTRAIEKHVVIHAPVSEVWRAWTTHEGCTSFFAPACRINPVVGGAYEMYFMPDADIGRRGGEGCTILAMQKEKLLSFTWNAPPQLPDIREQFTHVSLYFDEMDGQTRLLLVHDGWGVNELWDRAFAYFDRAWGDIVLPRLQRRFDEGPIKWDSI